MAHHKLTLSVLLYLQLCLATFMWSDLQLACSLKARNDFYIFSSDIMPPEMVNDPIFYLELPSFEKYFPI